MRSFEFALKNNKKMYPKAQLPEYQTKKSAGADFFCAEKVVIPSIWKQALSSVYALSAGKLIFYDMDSEESKKIFNISPTLVHTGIKSCMEDDEVLELYNRSSNPKKLGLILANSVGVVDADYYSNPDNDGEIMFAFYNFKPWDTTLEIGDRIGQGVFKKFLRPTVGLVVKEAERTGGFGSTSTSTDTRTGMSSYLSQQVQESVSDVFISDPKNDFNKEA